MTSHSAGPLGLDNDTRGWILCIVSSIACALGALFVCVDIPIRHLVPSQRRFRIQDSNAFQACALSLSFGVMIFSALFSMLPSSSRYLANAGYSPRAAGFILMACFIGGFVGIQLVSRLLHQLMPSHVVDCDHNHDDQLHVDPHASDYGSQDLPRSRSILRRSSRWSSRRPSAIPSKHLHPYYHHDDSELLGETTPLMAAADQPKHVGPDDLQTHPHHQLHSSVRLGDRHQRLASMPVGGDVRHGIAEPLVRRHSLAVRRLQSHDRLPSHDSLQSHDRRSSVRNVQRRVVSFVKDTLCDCDELNRCYGFSDPCGQECFKHLASPHGHGPAILRTTTGTTYMAHPLGTPLIVEHPTNAGDQSSAESTASPTTIRRDPRRLREPMQQRSAKEQQHPSGAGAQPTSLPNLPFRRAAGPEAAAVTHGMASSTTLAQVDAVSGPRLVPVSDSDASAFPADDGECSSCCHTEPSSSPATPIDADPPTDESDSESQSHHHLHLHNHHVQRQHHHHVPTNAFMSISLQTVMAIALHKFPEGFLTYATNHASPSLGFNVFMALFVHNIAEGFSMALPLYMALASRTRAILWSAALGGLSQPLGAAVAVIWLRMASSDSAGDDGGESQVDNAAYACMFAVTAGIMASVGLQLFAESLSLNHSRNLCVLFAFLGMAVLGLSNALVAGSGHQH